MTTGLDVFDTTLQETNLWLKDLMGRLGTDSRRLAYKALRATLHAIRDRVGPENAVHLGAQLPILIRGFYYEGWHMAGTPTRERHKPDFLAHVEGELYGDVPIKTERAVREVLALICERLDAGEINKLIPLFPMELRDLWPAGRIAGIPEGGEAPGWHW